MASNVQTTRTKEVTIRVVCDWALGVQGAQERLALGQRTRNSKTEKGGRAASQKE